MKRLLQLGNIISLLFALVANFLVGAQVLHVASINSISDKYATLLTPASYAFSIWSLIYILLLVFAVYQARDIFKPDTANDLPLRTGPFFMIASVCNGLWTLIFVKEFIGLSVVVLLLLTASLYAMLWRLKIAVTNPPARVIVAVWWPLMLYTGWVTIATIVNLASWLKWLDVPVGQLLAVTTLIVVMVLLLILLVKRNLREVLVSAAWGIVAIGINQVQVSDSHTVAAVAFMTAGVLMVAVVVHAVINRQSNPFYTLLN